LASRRRSGGSDPSEQCSGDQEKTHECDEPRSQSVLFGSPCCQNHAAMLERPELTCTGALWVGGGRLFQSGPCPTQLFVPLDQSRTSRHVKHCRPRGNSWVLDPRDHPEAPRGLPRSRLQPRLSRCRRALGMRDRTDRFT
jgi:hypothetical protein